MTPRMSISFVYLLASRTAVLGNDPMLFFSMMLMPTGPSSLVISGLAELAHISEVERLVIVKVLTVSRDSLIDLRLSALPHTVS